MRDVVLEAEEPDWFSPRVVGALVVDGRAAVVAADGGEWWVHDLGTGAVLATGSGEGEPDGTGDEVVAFHADADGAVVVTGGPGGLTFRDAVTAQLLGRVAADGPAQRTVACARLDGRLVAVDAAPFEDAGTQLVVWEAADGHRLRETLVLDDVVALTCPVVEGVAVTATAGASGRLAVHRLDRQRPAMAGGPPLPRAPIVHPGGVSALGWVVVGDATLLVAGGRDGSIRLWDAVRETPWGHPLAGHVGPVAALATTVLRGRPAVVSLGADGLLFAWDVTTSAAVAAAVCGSPGEHRELACTEVDGRAVAVVDGGAAPDPVVRVWEPTAPSDPGTLRGRATVAGWADLAGGTRLLTGHGDGTVVVDGRPAGPGHRSAVADLDVGVVDGRVTAFTTGYDGELRVWDVDAGRSRAAGLPLVPGARAPLACGDLGGRCVVVVGGHDGSVRVWDPSSGALLVELLGGVGLRRLASWEWVSPTVDPRRGRPLAHHSPVTAVTTLRRGRDLIAVTGDASGAVRLWDAATGTALGELTAPGRVRALSSAVVDGDEVVVVGQAGRTSLWRPGGDRPVVTLGAGCTEGRTAAVAVRAGRPVVVTGDADGTVAVGELGSGRVVARHRFPGPVRSVAAGSGSAVAVVHAEGLTVLGE